MNDKYLIENGSWQTFELLMTPVGFEKLENELSTLGNPGPQVYVHVFHGGYRDQEIIRIGKAKHGVIDRWINQGWGHKSTFMWSIGEEKRYASYAERYPNYLAFFAGLSGVNTELNVLSCELDRMNKLEKYLIQQYYPLWESYKRSIKPYLDQNPMTRKRLSEYGGAFNLIEDQRKSETSTARQQLIDVLGIRNKSHQKWDSC